MIGLATEEQQAAKPLLKLLAPAERPLKQDQKPVDVGLVALSPVRGVVLFGFSISKLLRSVE